MSPPLNGVLIALKQVMVPQEKTKAFSLCFFFQKSNPQRKIERMFVQKQQERFVRTLHYVRECWLVQGLEKIPYNRGSGSESILGASRKGSPTPKHTHTVEWKKPIPLSRKSMGER